MDRNLNELLRWGIENSDATKADPSAQTSRDASRGLNQEVLDALLGGPTHADLMKEAMAIIKSSDASLENKLTAFDNFEQLVENIDNANNIEALKLWEPLLAELQNSEPELRAMAAWCIGTAVQNNIKAQEKITNLGTIPRLTNLAISDADQGVRKKAILALSSGVRNYQPALDQMLKDLPESMKKSSPTDANDMEAMNSLMQTLRDASSKKQSN